jgi:UTP--glucose-1-phosphate uridylyltransferase
MKITKAVIAAAGLGTRFLPATKAVPKEMLPLLDRPILQHVVEEAVNSGITDIVLVIRRGSHAITDHFDSAPELERTLEATGKLHYLEEIRRVSRLANFAFVRQGDDLPYGNGSPVLAASPFIDRDEAFGYMFGDDVIDADPPGLRQVMDAYHRYKPAGAMAAYEVPWEETHLYGCIKLKEGTEAPEIENLIEKPDPGRAPSNLIQVGRFVVPYEIVEILEERKLGKGGELWMADAMLSLAQRRRVVAQRLEGTWYTTGDPWRLLQTYIALALKDDSIGPQLRQFLQGLRVEHLPNS